MQELQAALAEVKTLREILPIFPGAGRSGTRELLAYRRGYISTHTSTRFQPQHLSELRGERFDPRLQESDASKRAEWLPLLYQRP